VVDVGGMANGEPDLDVGVSSQPTPRNENAGARVPKSVQADHLDEWRTKDQGQREDERSFLQERTGEKAALVG
jgi:hypothetical protein